MFQLYFKVTVFDKNINSLIVLKIIFYFVFTFHVIRLIVLSSTSMIYWLALLNIIILNIKYCLKKLKLDLLYKAFSDIFAENYI